MRFDNKKKKIMKTNWQKLNNISLTKLVETRKQLHQAVQLSALTGRAFLPKVDDDHFASLLWNKEKDVLSGQAWGKDNYKTALNFKEFSILLLDKNNETINSFSLNEISYNNAFKKLKEMVELTGEDADKLSTSPPYEIPVYPTATNENFNFFEKIYFEELGKYFANANLVLKNVVKNNPEASEIGCWPHHFDIATLLVLNDNKDNYKSVGVGLSPGDDNYDQPYFYITPWPYPNIDAITLPDLPSSSFWHTEGWVGAILTAENILNFNSAEEQHNAVNKFIDIGIKENKDLM